jgi:hypothetical protein
VCGSVMQRVQQPMYAAVHVCVTSLKPNCTPWAGMQRLLVGRLWALLVVLVVVGVYCCLAFAQACIHVRLGLGDSWGTPT